MHKDDAINIMKRSDLNEKRGLLQFKKKNIKKKYGGTKYCNVCVKYAKIKRIPKNYPEAKKST